MPVTNDDVRALDMISSGGGNPQELEQIKLKLGYNDDDVRAWQLSKTSNPEESEELKVKVLDRVRTRRESEADTPIGATIAGGLQGVTFGFSDEIEAGLKAGVEKFQKGGDFKKIYESKVKKERAELKRLEEKHPIQFIGSELAASVLLPIPGSATFKGGKALHKLGLLAAESLATSAGKAEGEFGSKQFLEEIGKGTALGVGGGALLGKGVKGASKLIAKGEKPVKKAAKVVSSVLFDLPPAYTEKLINPRTAQKILNPKSSEEIAESVIDLTKNMGKHARALSLKAQDKLSEKPSIAVNDIFGLVKNVPSFQRTQRSSLKEATAATKAGALAMEDLGKRANGKGLVSEAELKRFIQDIDQEIPWNKNDWKLKDTILGDIRKTVDHDILKRNADYAEAMVPVNRIMTNLKDISKSFSLKRQGFDTVATDATHSKVKSFFNVAGISKKPVTEKALLEAEGRFAGPAKPSILEDIELKSIASRTEGGLPAGSKHILQGTVAGSLFGAPWWGLVAGAVKDRYGRKVGKSLIPKLSGAIDFADEGVKKGLEQINPEITGAIFKDIGRVLGARSGVGAANQPSPLLPERRTNQSLLPNR